MLPQSVSRVVERYLERLAAEDVSFLRGIYLVGSIALDDYQEGRSDIDFAGVTDGPLDEERIARLARVHAAMPQPGSPHLDGFYIAADRLGAPPEPDHAQAFVQEGAFRAIPSCYEINPVTWHLWRSRGITLAGPVPDELGLLLDDEALLRFEIANLKTYWSGWIDTKRTSLVDLDETDRIEAGFVSWGVLGVARLACGMATGRIVSKTEAGRWARETCRREEIGFVDIALAARRGDPVAVTADEALAALMFMERIIRRSLSLERH